jgi:multiple sugar transport system substrate-binding protein
VNRRILMSRAAGLAALGTTAFTAACAMGGGTGSAGDPAAKPTAAGPQKVDVWWSIADNNPSIAPAWEDFQKRHPGWTGELQMGVTFDKFQATLASGTVPDAYFGSFQQVQVGAYKKFFQPLDPFIARDKVNMDQYYVGSKAGAVYKGKVYAMPHHSNVRSVYVNDKIYREAGLDPTKAPTSWDDFRTANQRMKKEDGSGLDKIGYNPTWQIGGPTAVMYFQANDVPLMNADQSAPGFVTPGGTEAMKWILDSVQALGGKPQLDEWQKKFAKGIGEALGKGNTGMIMAGIWVVPRDAFAVDPNTQVSHWPIPGGPNAKGKSFGYVAATSGVVPVGAARPDAGWEWTKYQSSAEGQVFIQAAGGSWDQACIDKVANDPAVLQRQPWRKRANELLQQARHTAYFPHPGAVEIEAAMNKVVDDMLLGKFGPDAALQEMRQQVQVAMDQYK